MSLAENCGGANSFKPWLNMCRFAGTLVNAGKAAGGISAAAPQVCEKSASGGSL